MERIGVIDIASNSVRLVLAEVQGKNFRLIDDLKESVRLGEDLVHGDTFSDEKISYTLKTLSSFKTLCSATNANTIIAVATDALKIAKNGSYLIDKIKEQTGIEVRILSTEEVAYYDALGVSKSLYAVNSLMIDMGGSATILAWIRDNKLVKSCKLPFGSVSLTKQFNLSDRILYENIENLNTFIEDNLSNIPWLKENTFHNIIGVGGSIRTLGKIDRRRKRYPIDISHNYIFYDYDLHDINNALRSKDLKQRNKIEGLSKDRADIIVGASSFLVKITESLGINEIKISGKGLREGILFNHIEEKHGDIGDILDYSIQGVLENHNIDKNHATQVYKLALKLYEGLKPLHHLKDDYKDILKTASYLHDSGISIRYYDHHIHSFYIILNSMITGLSHRETLLSAFAAAYHRNNNFEFPFAHFCSIINRLDISNAEYVAILIRIAESLDRSLSGSVEDINVSFDEENVFVEIIAKRNVELEINEALKSKEVFEKIYDRNLVLKTI